MSEKEKVGYKTGVPTTWAEVETYLGYNWDDLPHSDYRRRLLNVLNNVFEVPKLKVTKMKNKPKPKPPPFPPYRLIREGTIGDCPKCGSTTKKRFIIFGPSIGCIQPECNNHYKNR